jgi:hypothetical protein
MKKKNVESGEKKNRLQRGKKVRALDVCTSEVKIAKQQAWTDSSTSSSELTASSFFPLMRQQP